jgi:DNA-binding MarR family transcriptional regulator
MSDQSKMSAARCAAANIRRTDRVLSQFYDAALAPSGLLSTQFGLLAVLAQLAPTAMNHLAERLEMDRTTLTRNLGVLIKQQLVRIEEGDDRRVHMVRLTPAGEAALERAWPLWQAAQTHIETALGRERFDALLAELAAVRALVSSSHADAS